MERKSLDFSKIKTYPVNSRKSLFTLSELLKPSQNLPFPKVRLGKEVEEEMEILSHKVSEAKRKGRRIVFFIGAHVIKCGLSLYLIELMKKGFVSHLAGNGAVSIHDFELAAFGATSEDVFQGLKNGTFGMWEETGRWMNEAINNHCQEGLGYGEALASYIHKNPKKFPHREVSILYQARRIGLPLTFHIALGADIIHQHPAANFERIGKAAGIDFKKFCQTIALLEGGVFLNFGSQVMGPEVFLKALSIARNCGFQVENFTTANFDLIDLGNYRKIEGHPLFHYYYRPWKNIVSRPVKDSSSGFHFCLDHRVSLPLLYQKLVLKSK